MNGNPVTPNTALLVYRLVEGDKAAFASIDGYHLTNALRLISRYADLVLQVGPNWLGSDGQVRTSAPPVFAVAHHQLGSQRYAYSVEAGMPEGEVWRYMEARYPALFSLVVFSGCWQARSRTGCKSALRPPPMNCSGRWAPMNSCRTTNQWFTATACNGPAVKC